MTSHLTENKKYIKTISTHCLEYCVLCVHHEKNWSKGKWCYWVRSQQTKLWKYCSFFHKARIYDSLVNHYSWQAFWATHGWRRFIYLKRTQWKSLLATEFLTNLLQVAEQLSRAESSTMCSRPSNNIFLKGINILSLLLNSFQITRSATCG